jgi:predicted small lipoprotein YifL
MRCFVVKVIKFLYIFLGLATLTGCGTGGDLELSSQPPEPVDAISVVQKNGQDKITVDTSQAGMVRYLGEIENKGKQKYCFISISFVTRGANDQIIDQGIKRVPLIGTTLSLGGLQYSDCLSPGEFGSFDSGYKPIQGTFDHYEFRICENPNSTIDIGCSTVPTATVPRVTLEPIPIALNPGQNAGMRVFSGILSNLAPDGSNLNAYDVHVVFTILDPLGNVIGTHDQSVETANTCNVNGTTIINCIRPGDGINFSAATDTLAGNTCDDYGTCYYYRIHHSE